MQGRWKKVPRRQVKRTRQLLVRQKIRLCRIRSIQLKTGTTLDGFCQKTFSDEVFFVFEVPISDVWIVRTTSNFGRLLAVRVFLSHNHYAMNLSGWILRHYHHPFFFRLIPKEVAKVYCIQIFKKLNESFILDLRSAKQGDYIKHLAKWAMDLKQFSEETATLRQWKWDLIHRYPTGDSLNTIQNLYLP